jgi:hypothetical protein
MDQELSSKTPWTFRRNARPWPMCLIVRREAEALLKGD